MPNITRQQLLSLPESGQRDEFIEIATLALAAQPEDGELRLALVRCLTEYGLLHRAAETASGFAPDVLGDAGLRGLLQQLRVPTQNGLVDWAIVQPTFERNLQALAERYPWVDQIRGAFDPPQSGLELHKTREGRWEVFDIMTSAWRPGFGRHQPTETYESIRRQVENRVIAPLVIEGVGLGAHLPRYASATYRTMNSSSPFVYQVETDWRALAVALHLVDWSDLIDDPRIILCVGPDAYEQLDESIDRFPHSPLPKSLVWTPAWTTQTGGRAEPLLKRHADKRHTIIAQLRDELNACYANRDESYWARRFAQALDGDGPPLRVLSVTCRFTTVLQYATRDALAALAAIGCETRVVIEPDDQSHISPIAALETIREFEPDLILLIDHTRASQPAIVIQNVPVLTWIQDRLPWLFDAKVGESMGPLDFVMGQGQRDLVEKYAYPGDRFFTCEMATDVARLTSPLPAGTDASQFDCEIAFATHASETPEAFTQSRLAECDNPKGRSIINGIVSALNERQQQGILNGAINFPVFVREVEESLGASLSPTARDALIDQFARPLAERMIRQQTLRWAANWARAAGGRLHIYGEGWARHPEFAEFARGTLEHGPALGEAFRRAKVNLHAGCNLALHQRVLDGLAAGGFFIARRHAGDIGLPLMRAIRAFLRQRGMRPPTRCYGVDLPPPWHGEFERLSQMKGVDAGRPFEFNESNLARIDAILANEDIVVADQLWPDFEALTFAGEAEFVETLEYYLERPDLRQETSVRMREGVLEHFGYERLMRDVLAFTAERLVGESSNEGSHDESNTVAVAEANW